MRKLASKTDAAKKKRRSNTILGIILIAIMFMSVLGYGLGSYGSDDASSEEFNYGDFVFQRDAASGFWILETGGNQFAFSYNPEEVEKIGSSVNGLDSYLDKPLYISSQSELAEQEIFQNLYQHTERVQKACVEGEICGGSLPLKTCEDKLIIIREAEISDIRQEENCVFIDGPGEELLRLSDAFLFKVLGIEQ